MNTSRSRHRLAALFWLGCVLVGAVGCKTIILGKPDPVPEPADCVLVEIEAGVAGECVQRYLGRIENYADYIEALRGE